MVGWLACSAPCCLSSGASGRCGCSLFWDPVTDHPCSRVTSALITLAGGQSGGSGERRRPRHTGCLLRRQARPALRWAVLACAATCCVHAHTHTRRGRVEGGWHPKMHGWSSAHRHPRSILLMPDFKLLHCDILAGGGPVHTTTIDCRCPAKHRPAPRGFSALLSGGGPEHITNY